jgi:hypothetical protein
LFLLGHGDRVAGINITPSPSLRAGCRPLGGFPSRRRLLVQQRYLGIDVFERCCKPLPSRSQPRAYNFQEAFTRCWSIRGPGQSLCDSLPSRGRPGLPSRDTSLSPFETLVHHVVLLLLIAFSVSFS